MMSDFLDIAPVPPRSVRIGDDDVAVWGLSGEGLASLCLRFPEEMQKAWEGPLTLQLVMQLGPKPLRALIAAGLGYPGDEKAEALAAKLPVRKQAEALEAIYFATLGDDPDVFISQLVKYLSAAGGLVAKAMSEAASTASSKPSQNLSNS